MPFYVLDLGEVEARCTTMRRELPTVSPFYAVKCNNDPVLLRHLAERGLSFDCATKSEMMQVLGLGVEPHRIIFANTFKNVADIVFAAEHGVTLMTFDSVDELLKIRTYFPQARLLIRLKEPSIEESAIQVKLGEKFGCTLDEVEELLRVCQQLDLQVIGSCFHVGASCYEETMWSRAIEDAAKVFKLAECLGIKMTLLDIGGGYPGEIGDETRLKEIFSTIRTSLEEHFPPSSGVHIIAEPGTLFVKSAVSLVARITSRRMSRGLSTSHVLGDINPLYKNDLKKLNTAVDFQDVWSYVLSAGVYSAFMGHAVYGEEHRAIVVKDVEDHTDVFPCILWGPTCDSFDRVSGGLALLPLLQMGDWLYFENVGSYTSTCASDFNGCGLPALFCLVTLE